MANGPDGWLWVVDMYRELIEGAAFLPPRILKHMDVGSGVDRGRIWRWGRMGTRQGYQGSARRRQPSWSHCWTTPTAGTATRPRDCFISGRTIRRRAAAATGRRVQDAAGTNTRIARARRSRGSRARMTCLRHSLIPEPRVAKYALRLGEPFCPNDERIQTADGGIVGDADSTSATSWPFRWVRCRIADRSMRSPCWRSRWGGLLDANGDSELRVGLHGRAFSPAGRQPSVPHVGDTASFLDHTGRRRWERPARPDDVAAVVKELDGPLAGDKSLCRARSFWRS